MFCDNQYTEKPTGYEIGIIQKKLSKTTISISELAKSMAKGCTFKPAYLNGTTAADFISQQLFALDFDEGTTIESELERCKQLNIMPVFAYTSFNHKPEHHKFRLVFCNRDIVYDINKRNQIQLSLMGAFSKCDIRCKDGSRLFFGGKTLIMLDDNNTIDGDSIIEKYYIKSPSTKRTVTKERPARSQRPKGYRTITEEIQKEIDDKIKAISELNVAEMRRLLNRKETGNPYLDILLAKRTKALADKFKMNFELNGISYNAVELSEKLDDINLDEMYFCFDNKAESIIQDEEEIETNYKNMALFLSIILDGLMEIEKENYKCYAEEGVFSDTDKKDIFFYQYHLKPRTPTQLYYDIINVIDKKIFKCRKDLLTYIKTEIDLGEYLGIGEDMVCCILPEHDDNSPSAHIICHDNGTQLYKCFGCDTVRTIISITEQLAKCKPSEAIEFIKKVYDLELIESEWTQQQKQLLINMANYLGSEELKLEYPTIYKIVRTRIQHIQVMLIKFSEMVNEEMQIDGKPFFFASYPNLMNLMNVKNRTQLTQSIALFALLELLEKLPEDKIPDKELTKAKAIAAKYGLKKLTSFYAFEEYGVNTFAESEKKAIILKENNVSLKGLSRELVLSTFGIDEANRVYPQYKYENDKGTSEKSDEHTAEIVQCISYCIENKGYATERNVVDMLRGKYNIEKTEVQIKRRLQEILNAYSLRRERTNKELKAKYNVEGNGYPYIIVRNED